MEGARPVRAPRGTTRTARSWYTEGPLRMSMHNPELLRRGAPIHLVTDQTSAQTVAAERGVLIPMQESQ